jgi:hypothetical protein
MAKLPTIRINSGRDRCSEFDPMSPDLSMFQRRSNRFSMIAQSGGDQ